MKKIKLEISFNKKFPFIKIRKIINKKKKSFLREITEFFLFLLLFLAFISFVSLLTFYRDYYSNYIYKNNQAITGAKLEFINIKLWSWKVIYTWWDKKIKIWLKNIESKLNLKHIFQYNNIKDKIKICLYQSNKIFLNNPSSPTEWLADKNFLSAFKRFITNKAVFVDGLAIRKIWFNMYWIKNNGCDYTIILYKLADLETFYHEFGHIIDFYLIANNNKYREERKKIFLKYHQESWTYDYTRGYWATNSYEDIATIIEHIPNWQINFYKNKSYLLRKKIEFLEKYIK